MREKLLAIGDDFWIENDRGERAYKVNGKALRVRQTGRRPADSQGRRSRHVLPVRLGQLAEVLPGLRVGPQRPDASRTAGAPSDSAANSSAISASSPP